MKVSRELKTAAIAISGIALFIWGFSYIKGENLFEKPRVFYAEYENVQGLLPSAGVTVNGLKVGKIESITFHPKKVGRLVVKFSVENDFQFSENSTAQIYSPDFISGKSIKILPNYQGSNAVSGDTLVANIEADILGSIGDKLIPLEGKISGFVVNAEKVFSSLDELLNDKGEATNLKQSFAKLNSTLSSFNSASKSLDKILAKDGQIDSILKNANTAAGNLVGLTDSLNNANLTATIKKLETTLTNFNNVLADIENGKGSIGKLMKDEALYENLEGASKEMEELLRELKLNPKRFVHFSLFGKKAKMYKEEISKESKEID